MDDETNNGEVSVMCHRGSVGKKTHHPNVRLPDSRVVVFQRRLRRGIRIGSRTSSRRRIQVDDIARNPGPAIHPRTALFVFSGFAMSFPRALFGCIEEGFSAELIVHGIVVCDRCPGGSPGRSYWPSVSNVALEDGLAWNGMAWHDMAFYGSDVRCQGKSRGSNGLRGI